MRRILIMVFIALAIISCNKNKILDQKVVIPSTLEHLNDSKSGLLDTCSTQILKLVCLIDANCEECIKRVNSWQSFIDTLTKKNIDTHIILQTPNCGSLKKYLFKEFKTEANYYLDSNYEYYSLNIDLFTNNRINAHVMLLDSTNRIKMYGDPFLNKSTKKIYLYAINKFQIN